MREDWQVQSKEEHVQTEVQRPRLKIEIEKTRQARDVDQ